MVERLYLIKVPVRADRLAAFARQRALPLRVADTGYLVHCVLKEAWQDAAPRPFVVRGTGRSLDVWAYSLLSADELRIHAAEFGDPAAVNAILDVGALAAREVPCFESGRCLGFRLRACPVVRLARTGGGYKSGAEVDAFLAACLQVGPDVAVSREGVYREWLSKKLDVAAAGVNVELIRIAGLSRDRLLRRTHGVERRAGVLDRPSVHFEGEFVVADGQRLLDFLQHGVGRHRAFGFGALMIVPPVASLPDQRVARC